jgi:hypothetical protein
MKNKLTDLQNHLFELMEKLNDDDLKGDDLDQENKRSEAFSTLAEIAVKNAVLIAKCAEVYGLPITGDLALLPVSQGDNAKETGNKRQKKTLLNNRDEYDE